MSDEGKGLGAHPRADMPEPSEVEALVRRLRTVAESIRRPGRNDSKAGKEMRSAADMIERLARRAAGWRDMASAPKDGKHCILSIEEGALFYSVQGAFQDGKWNCVHRDNVEPLAWMPNVLLPDAFIRARVESSRAILADAHKSNQEPTP